MKKQNVLPAIVLVGLVTMVAVGLLVLPGAESLKNDLGTVIRWVGNLLLTILILLVFVVGPGFVGGLAVWLVNMMLWKTHSSWYWHWAFQIASGALLLLGWPYLIQTVIMIPADWTSGLFFAITTARWTGAESVSGYMVYETPPVGWGIYASATGVVVYSIFIDRYHRHYC